MFFVPGKFGNRATGSTYLRDPDTLLSLAPRRGRGVSFVRDVSPTPLYSR